MCKIRRIVWCENVEFHCNFQAVCGKGNSWNMSRQLEKKIDALSTVFKQMLTFVRPVSVT
jgi:hypothetical protein